ncbi:hypothetical protein GLOTRDRAFT_117600 [Gloeophyllum trabeum ATCC 11539]|uniref:Uncharacterized protein n=1 Tax=Gloeophyllum trabeum (strain ATCC 11539 / FP-39264 / Madison 617) TaxID=670483 RepID=S7PXR8_GLOTA|nr:uncharacterized protein GLOTRDRAFT_117600 [Gloeophyllum trabeum ATCC 11539]EPQ52107.1 hypothetical protein GLOTRDRAFT_117600 [Gloeophyllum trabeum ATCC 11539]
MSQPQAVAARSPLSLIFMLHIALEIPFVIQGLWAPQALPFIQLNNTTLVMVKLYAALSLGTCIAAFLVFSLPEFLPGKRALAIGLCVYHSLISTVLYQAPRFIPRSFGPLAESYNATPENVWGTLHGIVGLGMVFWWQGTVQYAQLARRAQ